MHQIRQAEYLEDVMQICARSRDLKPEAVDLLSTKRVQKPASRKLSLLLQLETAIFAEHPVGLKHHHSPSASFMRSCSKWSDTCTNTSAPTAGRWMFLNQDLARLPMSPAHDLASRHAAWDSIVCPGCQKTDLNKKVHIPM